LEIGSTNVAFSQMLNLHHPLYPLQPYNPGVSVGERGGFITGPTANLA